MNSLLGVQEHLVKFESRMVIQALGNGAPYLDLFLLQGHLRPNLVCSPQIQNSQDPECSACVLGPTPAQAAIDKEASCELRGRGSGDCHLCARYCARPCTGEADLVPALRELQSAGPGALPQDF